LFQKIQKMKNNLFVSVIISLLVFASACSSEETAFMPKPKGYNKIDLPAHSYDTLTGDYPYTFEYSSLAKIMPDTSKTAEPYWIDIYYPEFRANIQITYKKTNNNLKTIEEYIKDSHTLANKHNVKAYAIDELITDNKNGYAVKVFELSGDVPSQVQFHATDTTKNFLRGAVYFRTSTKNDSLAPVIKYMKEDVMHLIETLKFK
jgi:gliding motility-associated lipoprotein GldD